MQRYFVEPHLFSEREVTITGDDVHHIVNVMRAKSGEEIIVSDGAGRSAIVRIDSLSGKEVVATVVELLREQRELPVQITIGQGLPKGEKMEWVLQKGTELGAFAFFLFPPSGPSSSWTPRKRRRSWTAGARLSRKRRNSRIAVSCRSCWHQSRSDRSWRNHRATPVR